MSILFSKIYSKAIALFDDPKITVAYETDKIQYKKLMYSFLQNAIGMFQNPSAIANQLANYTEPKGIMEVFEGDGETRTFELSEEFELMENSDYSYIEGDKKVTGKIETVTKQIPVETEWDIETGELDENGNPIIETKPDNTGFILKTVNTVTFPDVLPKGQQYAIEQYYCGEFTVNFSGMNRGPSKEKMITVQVEDILARLLVKAWAEEQRNDYTEVKSILTDTDFKKTAAYQMLNANNNFVRQLTVETDEMMNRLAWSIRFAQSASNLGRG